MKFIDYCNETISQYKEKGDYRLTDSGTLLLGHDDRKELFSHFKFYKPIDAEELRSYFKEAYKRKFPESLYEFYAFSNGATLFTVKIAHEEVQFFANPCLCVFGIPDREKDVTPYDLRIEDLARGWKIPRHWLKCGGYESPADRNTQFDIFIDTNDEHVYMTKKRKSKVVESYENLDACLCSLYERLSAYDLTKIIE